MKRILLLLLFGILFLTVQTTFLRSIPIQRIRPDFMLIFTLFLAFSVSPVLGGILAFLMGYLVDLFSGNTFGLYTFSRPLLFYGAYLFKSEFYVEGFSSQFIFVFLSACLEGVFVLILFTLVNPEPVFQRYSSVLLSLVPQSTFTALIAPLFIVLFQKGFGLTAGKEGAHVQERG
jgi:rod shape-determining protein MreD